MNKIEIFEQLDELLYEMVRTNDTKMMKSIITMIQADELPNGIDDFIDFLKFRIRIYEEGVQLAELDDEDDEMDIDMTISELIQHVISKYPNEKNKYNRFLNEIEDNFNFSKYAITIDDLSVIDFLNTSFDWYDDCDSYHPYDHILMLATGCYISGEMSLIQEHYGIIFDVDFCIFKKYKKPLIDFVEYLYTTNYKKNDLDSIKTIRQYLTDVLGFKDSVLDIFDTNEVLLEKLGYTAESLKEKLFQLESELVINNKKETYLEITNIKIIIEKIEIGEFIYKISYIPKNSKKAATISASGDSERRFQRSEPE